MIHDRFSRCRSLAALSLIALLGACGTAPTPAARAGFTPDGRIGDDPSPWTALNFQNDPVAFQFAIIGDRTGGANQEGTFALAMGQLNLLQPEFVISVGDMIEGYTDDEAELDEMWDEFEGIVAELEVPFFYVRGNHDVSNGLAKEVWRDRRGPNYYHFVYRDVLFVALDSEDAPRPEPTPEILERMTEIKNLQKQDPEKAKQMIAEFMKDDNVVAALGTPVEFPQPQIDWLERTLATHRDVRWTFLFMHEPCWERPSESFDRIRALLADRPHTWFAGHLHYYDYDLIDGVEYITMGPAGASLHHEGPGNVDHVTWVTMTERGPQMGNIALKGLFDRKGLDPTLFGAYDRKGSGEPDISP